MNNFFISIVNLAYRKAANITLFALARTREAARQFVPDFLLLDIGLPGMNGYEVALLLRSEDAFRDTVILAVSDYGEQKARDRTSKLGFDHHLTKPMDFEY